MEAEFKEEAERMEGFCAWTEVRTQKILHFMSEFELDLFWRGF